MRTHPPTQPVYLTVRWLPAPSRPSFVWTLLPPRNWILPRPGRGGLEEPHKETVSRLSLKSDTFCGQNNSWAEVRVIRPFYFGLASELTEKILSFCRLSGKRNLLISLFTNNLKSFLP